MSQYFFFCMHKKSKCYVVKDFIGFLSFMHLADAFLQSNLHSIQKILSVQAFPWESKP